MVIQMFMLLRGASDPDQNFRVYKRPIPVIVAVQYHEFLETCSVRLVCICSGFEW